MSLDSDLNRSLSALREQNLFRELSRVDSPQSPHLQIDGKAFLSFSSNDYLGLANHPSLKEAAVHAIEKFGTGSGASRLVCGSLAPFHELETALARFKQTEAALSFSTGYAAAMGTICALLGKDDIIILDKLVHACIVDAAKLSGAKIRVFAHNDLEDLEEKLKWAGSTRGPIAPPGAPSATTPGLLPNKDSVQADVNPASRILIVTESIFSMDGDAAPLREIVALKEKYGAWLMVDEAHATGIIGQHGRGLAEYLGVSAQIEIQMGTLGKALGASGGFICGTRSLIDLLVNRARSFIFSTAPVPAAAAAATAAVKLTQSAEGEKLRRRLQSLVEQFQSAIQNQKSKIASAIIPIILGNEAKAVQAATKLREQNIFVPAIRYPTVARGAARLRVTLSASHSSDDIACLIAALKALNI
ncbi:MAG TPA: 8-amino-7-oxononanoate synthase [Candidatus Acidoferrales bacterium]|jgi:8-amino-7-oxononanoate synthase|nr:8-amino-7-oxononanoate synthase [Candidatus Acidoferrales bacterium]